MRHAASRSLTNPQAEPYLEAVSRCNSTVVVVRPAEPASDLPRSYAQTEQLTEDRVDVNGTTHARRPARRGRAPPGGRASRACCSPTTSRRCPSDIGYRGPTACNAAGITYRQLDYWARTGLVEPTVRGADRLRHPAALLLPRHPGPQGRQAAARRRHLAAADPHRGPAPARARHRRPDPRHPDERRRLGLRVHQQRRGHRPAPGRPGRLRHRDRRGLARDRGLARRAAQRAHRRRRGRADRRRRARRAPRAPASG